MEALGMLINGFTHAVSPANLLASAMGVLIGTMVGVLPGLGASSSIAILLPLTAVLDSSQAIIMLSGIYYGAQYGGSTTAILLNIPGETSSLVTCLDGYPLAQQGRGGPALGIAALASFCAGTIGTLGLVFFAPFLADQALSFGPPEFFSLMLLSLTIISSFVGDSKTKALLMAFFGFLLSMVGIGLTGGLPRFTYGTIILTGGFELVSVIIGVFGITEALKGLEEEKVSISTEQIGSVYPTWHDILACKMAVVRGGVIGFLLGLIPGCSPSIATFLSYDLEKRASKNPERFGRGAIEGVAAPEAANNSNCSAGFIPLFALGIPTSNSLALLLAGLMIYGLQPGPLLFEQDGGFVWTVIASMFIGNTFLLILNLPLVKVWAKLAMIPYGILGPVILIFCVIGSYTLRNSLFDVTIAVLFGALGYFFNKYRWPLIPMVLSFVLGPTFEKSFIQSMQISGDNPLIFFQRPISVALLVLTGILIIASFYLKSRTKARVKEVAGAEVEISDEN